MPAIIRSEFALALNQVATERGITPEVIIETIKAAILAAYRKDYGVDELEQLAVDVNIETGEIKILKDGAIITPPGFGRIAAQTAKQVLLQRNREAEKQAVLADYQAKVGTIAPGMVLRFDGPNIIVDIGRTQAVMPVQEQSQGEHYHLNQRLTFYIEGIRETMRGNEIIVSRAHKGLVEGLFKREVPEVAQGSVELRAVAREAGGRTKVAVYSSQSGVDPVGSCVGQKGVRVQAVIAELGGSEKVDIIQWSGDAKQFIAASLAPAKDIEVTLNEQKKAAEVLIPEDQLSLAIGRDGQNVRLAAKVTGWKIDIRGKQVVSLQSSDISKEEVVSSQSSVISKEESKKEGKEDISPQPSDVSKGEEKENDKKKEVKEKGTKTKKEKKAASETAKADVPAAPTQPAHDDTKTESEKNTKV